jgi:hypothetical protein
LPPLRLAAAPYDPNTPPTGYGPYNTTINPIPTEPAGFVFRELLIQDTTTTAVSPSLVSLRESLAAGYSKYDTASNPTERHSTLQTFNFAFKPEPMPLFGEPVMQPLQAFHTSMGIPLDAVAMSKGYFDIIFAPSGEVIGGTGNIIALWVRDPKKGNGPTDYANAGEQVLIAIYARTGAVATHPVNTDGTDPFKFVRDGVNSGF